MSKINQIQNALKELDGGAFQKLADSYLLRKGYPQINPIGSVVGSNKVRTGTPDTLIPTAGNKYVFAEYTTISPDQVFNKFYDDITKCLDKTKTGIAVEKIEEIVLCYTSDLSPKNIDKLREHCENEGVNLNLFGLGAISYDLLEKYPSIAKDYLGIEVNSGQIVSMDEFISLYEKNKLTTSLQTTFQFRDTEKNNLVSSIKENSLVVVTGAAGIGKTRIAIECYRLFVKNNESYKSYCIFNRGIDLFEDVKSYFSDSGDFLIFIDDANRVSGFQYVIQLLQTKRDNQNFKILVTVRDYALDKIRELCRPLESGAEISLKPFTDEEIIRLVKNEFGINNHLYFERITDIAHGNPRLAVMAAQVAKESNTLESIRDVSELYDIYFSSIKSDLDALQDKNMLKVSGIVAFFRNVDRTDNNLMSDIQNSFNISSDNFWETAKKLHEMEVMDMFENEVVKISDQVLSTYLFYLIFFKDSHIEFSILINDFLPNFKQRIIDAINPILNAFDFNETKKTMEKSVDKVWTQIQARDESAFLQLIDVFWFLKPTETLIFIQNKIKSLKSQEIVIDNIKFEADSSSSLPEFLSTLPLFSSLGVDEIRMSLDLLLQYAEKRPADTPKILQCLIGRYGFQPDSYRYGYHIQHAVVAKVVEYCNSWKIEFFTNIFITLAENYLHTNFSATKLGRANSITITHFDLVVSDELLELRANILTNLFFLYSKKQFQQSILKLILNHSQSGLNISVDKIVEHESKLITSFFNNTLDSRKLYHCIIVQQYLNMLERFNIPNENEMKERFQSPIYSIYDLFTNRLDKKELKLSHEEYRKYSGQKIVEFTSSYSNKDYDEMLHELFSVVVTLEGHLKWQIDQGIISIIEELAKRNPELFSEVVENYLLQGEYLEITPSVIVSNLILLFGFIKAFKIISIPDYPSKYRWLFCYYQHLSIGDISHVQMDELLKLYNTSDLKYFVNDVDYLIKYESHKTGFISDVIQIIIDRTQATPELANSLSLLFNPHTEINKQFSTLFSGKLPLLEEAFIAFDRIDPHADYNGATISHILDNDPEFIERYLDDKFSRKSYLGRYDDNRDYSFIWLRYDYLSIMQKIIDVIFKYRQDGRCLGYSEIFFNKSAHSQDDKDIIRRQDEFLIGEISSKFNDNDFMCFIFAIIAGFESERKLILYKTFLDKNNEFGDFKNLPFEKMFSSWSGSAVPMLQEKIDFYQLIIPICNSVEYLKHRQFIEQRIQEIRKAILFEKKRDFTETW